MSLYVQVAAKTDVGCVRKNNEDAFGYSSQLGLFVVCDGMGGMAAGEVASKLAIDTMHDYFTKAAQNGHFPEVGNRVSGASERSNALVSAIHTANEAIYSAATAEGETRRGMGSTIVAVLADKNLPLFSIAHVGDSRIYRIRHGSLQQLTNDHSLVMEQVRRGMITREEAERSEMANIIIRALGPEPQVEPDVDEEVALPGDQLLLATDGLTKLVADARIQSIVQSARSLPVAVDALIQEARNEGGDDNITCVLLRFAQQPWYKQWFKSFGGGGIEWQSSC
jgi:serine/threonine protein phosphatase PrpC